MSQRSSAPFRPIVVDTARPSIEQRKYPRYALDLPGRFMRADKLDYPCRLKDISIVGASMTTATTSLAIGEKVIVYLLHLGGLEGAVTRRFEGGFAMAIDATQRKREKLAAQILHLAEGGPLPESEERQHPRSSCNERSFLVLADGTGLDCIITDKSVNGASITTPARPEIGTEVSVAGSLATVVRHHDEGIGIEFVNRRLQDLAAFERYTRGDGSQ